MEDKGFTQRPPRKEKISRPMDDVKISEIPKVEEKIC